MQHSVPALALLKQSIVRTHVLVLVLCRRAGSLGYHTAVVSMLASTVTSGFSHAPVQHGKYYFASLCSVSADASSHCSSVLPCTGACGSSSFLYGDRMQLRCLLSNTVKLASAFKLHDVPSQHPYYCEEVALSHTAAVQSVVLLSG
jgi:hypothetical protein